MQVSLFSEKSAYIIRAKFEGDDCVNRIKKKVAKVAVLLI